MEIKIEKIKTDRIEMQYFRFGKENAQPAAIIPGISLMSVMPYANAIARQYRDLASDFNIYVFDKNSDIKKGYSISDMADDSAEVFDILNLKSVNIYGVSLGGMISQTIAAKRKDLVNSIVLCSTASRLSENSLQIVNEWIKLAKEKNMSELMDSFARNIYSEKFYLKNKAVFPEFGKMATDKDIENFIILAEAIDSLTDMTGNIKCPAFVIGAENDKIFSAESSVELAEKLNAEYYIYKEYGHAVYDEAKDCPQKAGDFFRRFL